MTEEEKPKLKLKRGFASLDPEQRRAVASKGGKSVPREKRSFTRNRKLASEAGRKGGSAVEGSNRSFSRDRELAITSGAKGGIVAQARRKTTGDFSQS